MAIATNKNLQSKKPKRKQKNTEQPQDFSENTENNSGFYRPLEPGFQQDQNIQNDSQLTELKNIFSDIPFLQHTFFKRFVKVSFWFFFGACIGFFFFISFLFIFYQKTHTNKVYEGVIVEGVDFGGKTQEEVRQYFAQKNQKIGNEKVIITTDQAIATISAKQADFGYDDDLLAQQSYDTGRSDNMIANMSLIIQAYVDGITLPPAFRFSESKIDPAIAALKQKVDVKPVDPLFNFENGKVVAFRLSKDGKALDVKKLKEMIRTQFLTDAAAGKAQTITLKAPIMVVKPAVGTDKANNLGITELIGEGTSLFYHSIENRIYNISLAAGRLNGVLIPPGKTFSFTKTIGDISTSTGYKQAYVIENGKTVLGDGGGVCQVSTTLFRAALNAGLPVVERNPHAYRVGYYEQDSGPGIDAAVYYPTVDLKFKNDTGNYILIQSYADLANLRLTFQLYGTKDNRVVSMTDPVILSQTPAPEALYQDDPTLPKGQTKQIDFAAAGANVYFTRTVKKDGKVVISDKFVSNYRPWQAIFLRGTKE